LLSIHNDGAGDGISQEILGPVTTDEHLQELLLYIQNQQQKITGQTPIDLNVNSQPDFEYGEDSGVRPVRMNIIEGVRGMPTYYDGRRKKDLLKLTQFEMMLDT
jgi:hypothetical protein